MMLMIHLQPGSPMLWIIRKGRVKPIIQFIEAPDVALKNGLETGVELYF
jgi:hypothetical protein